MLLTLASPTLVESLIAPSAFRKLPCVDSPAISVNRPPVSTTARSKSESSAQRIPCCCRWLPFLAIQHAPLFSFASRDRPSSSRYSALFFPPIRRHKRSPEEATELRDKRSLRCCSQKFNRFCSEIPSVQAPEKRPKKMDRANCNYKYLNKIATETLLLTKGSKAYA